MAQSSDRAQEPRTGEPVSVADLSRQVLGRAAQCADGTVRAGYAWNLICGESGQRHTQGLYLETRADGARVLHVYLDSSPLIQDFQTDHLLYERRLAAVGLPVQSVRFELSRRADFWGAVPGVAVTGPAAEKPPAPETLPPLTPAQQASVDEAARGLPPDVAPAFRAAMELSLRRG